MKVESIKTEEMKLLLEKGFSEEKVHSLLSMGRTAKELNNLDPWSVRYITEGKMWGSEESSTAKTVARKVGPNSRIIEIGYGYGRDLKYMLEQGHNLVGIEEATEALSLALSDLKLYYDQGKLTFVTGDIKHSFLQQGFADAVYAHRMLHLIKPTSIKAFVNRVSGVMHTGGWLVLTARNHEDFNEEDMKKLDDDTAIYKKRDNHFVNFWNEDRFRHHFRGIFNNFSFHNFTEQESEKNPVESHLTMMIAQKMREAEIGIN